MLASDTLATLSALPSLPRICVPIAQPTPDAMFSHSTALFPEFPFQELRLDSLPDPVAVLPALRSHIHAHPSGIFLATCRRLESGGLFLGAATAERDILVGAGHAGCTLADLSLESAEVLGTPALAALRAAGCAVILSWHDFERTGDLGAVLDRMQPFAPDLMKLVPTARTLTDTLPLLRVLERRPLESPALIGISMGEAGVLSRVLGLRAGSSFTFAPGTLEEVTAPGQIAAPDLRELYRAPALRRNSRIYGVAGDPIRSSLSPLMLNTAFREGGVDASYLPLLTKDARELMQLARELPLSGFSVTMPLKQTILPLLDRVDPLAARIGAVNTVRREPDGSFSGFNTDAAGITSPLKARLVMKGARILVLGAGGAARAATFACVGEGAAVSVCNRTYASAAELASQAGAQVLSSEELADAAAFDVLIHATPAGMRQNATEWPLPPSQLPADLIFDLVYNPLETPLLRLAREQGRAVIQGVEMFIHQGARQFEIWTGHAAPVQTMRQVVLKALA